MGPMDESLPTGSITGQQDWEWNRLYGDRRSRAASGGDQPRGARSRERPFRPGRAPASRKPRERQPEDPALERTEQRLQYVITHYERLLAEKDRRLTDDADDQLAADWTAAVLAPLRRLAARL